MSIILFLTGGGFGSPALGMLSGVALLGFNARVLRNMPPGLKNFLAALGPWIFIVTVLNGIFLVIGHIILVFLFGVTNADLFLYSFFFAVPSLLLIIPAGVAYEQTVIFRDQITSSDK